MVVKSSPAAQIEQTIESVKYTLFCLSCVVWLFGVVLLGVTIWLRTESGFQEWVDFLNIGEFYYGVSVLIFAALVVVAVGFVGCGSSLMENDLALYSSAGLNALSFVVNLVGTAVLLDYSTRYSSIQEIIRKSMTHLIDSSYEDSRVAYTLKLVQEEIGCCGADGPNDYINYNRPLPAECRDSSTGNAWFHGCVDELTWFLEARALWVAGISLSICFMNVVQAVLSFILVLAIRKEEKLTTYSR